jgi:hypothetical protein
LIEQFHGRVDERLDPFEGDEVHSCQRLVAFVAEGFRCGLVVDRLAADEVMSLRDVR